MVRWNVGPQLELMPIPSLTSCSVTSTCEWKHTSESCTLAHCLTMFVTHVICAFIRPSSVGSGRGSVRKALPAVLYAELMKQGILRHFL